MKKTVAKWNNTQRRVLSKQMFVDFINMSSPLSTSHIGGFRVLFLTDWLVFVICAYFRETFQLITGERIINQPIEELAKFTS